MLGSVVSRICGAAMRANSASEMRSSFQLSESASRRRNRVERCQRSPETSLTRIDAEPSSRITRSIPPWRTSGPGRAGAASASTRQAIAAVTHSQKGRSPAWPKRSRDRQHAARGRDGDVGPPRAQTPEPQRPTSRAGIRAATATRAGRTRFARSRSAAARQSLAIRGARASRPLPGRSARARRTASARWS